MAAFDIQDWTYQGVNLGLSLVEPAGLWFKPDGLQVFIIDVADDKVKRFNMSVQDNISTALIHADEFQLEANAQGLSFSPDGTKMLYIDGQDITERVLSGAWDVTTAGAATQLDVSSDHASADPIDVTWADDGSSIFFTDQEDSTVKRYTMSTPYLLSSATIHASEIDMSARFPQKGIGGIFMKIDGTVIWVGVEYITDGSFYVQSPAVRQFNLSSAFDLTSAVEHTTTDADIAQLLSFMPHFATGDYDWVLGRNKDSVTGTVGFPESYASGAWIGGLTSGEGGMDWDTNASENGDFFGGGRTASATWEGRFRFFRKPDNAGLGGANRICFGSSATDKGHSAGPALSQPWSIIWRDTDEAFGLMASGAGIHISAGPEGGIWNYGQFLDFTITRVVTTGSNARFRFWLNGTYLGSRTTYQNPFSFQNAFAYGKNAKGSQAGWDFGSGIQQVWIRTYGFNKYTDDVDHASAEHDIDQTALNFVGRSVSDETGRESPFLWVAFDAAGLFGYVAANDPLVGNFIYQYNLTAVVGSCTGDGFKDYDTGGTVRLLVATVDGAHHLEGLTVTAVVDGAVHDATITDGQIILPAGITGAHIQVGFPFTADIVTLDIEEGDGKMQGKNKAVRELLIKFYKSVMPFIGPTKTNLVQMKNPEKDDFDEPLPLFSGQVRQRIERDWNPSGKVVMRVKDPFPFSVISVAPDVPEAEDD